MQLIFWLMCKSKTGKYKYASVRIHFYGLLELAVSELYLRTMSTSIGGNVLPRPSTASCYRYNLMKKMVWFTNKTICSMMLHLHQVVVEGLDKMCLPTSASWHSHLESSAKKLQQCPLVPQLYTNRRGRQISTLCTCCMQCRTPRQTLPHLETLLYDCIWSRQD